jgi:CDP-diacylglycerol--glycerol-3-phosphate 3-phosphatidyltransferase
LGFARTLGVAFPSVVSGDWRDSDGRDGLGEATPAPGAAAEVPRRGRSKRRRGGGRRPRPTAILKDAVNLPNLLTMLRIVVIPIFLFFLEQETRSACAIAALIYTGAAITDLLDGWLARRMNVVSVLGKFLDPLADKLIVMAALIWCIPMGRIHAWAVVLLLAREISVTGLRGVAASEGVVIAAGAEGKTKTALQMVGIVCLVIGYPYPMDYAWIDLGIVDVARIGRALVYLSLVFSLASATQYVRLFVAAVDAKNARAASRSSSA